MCLLSLRNGASIVIWIVTARCEASRWEGKQDLLLSCSKQVKMMMKYVKREVQVVHCLETPPSGHKHSISSQKTELESKNGQVCGGYPQILFYWEFPWLPCRHQSGLSSYLRWTKYSDMYMGRSWGDLFCTLWGYTMISCQVIAGLTERKTKQQLRIVMVGRRWLSRSTN